MFKISTDSWSTKQDFYVWITFPMSWNSALQGPKISLCVDFLTSLCSCSLRVYPGYDKGWDAVYRGRWGAERRKDGGLQDWKNRVYRGRFVVTKLTSFHYVLSYKGKGDMGSPVLFLATAWKSSHLEIKKKQTTFKAKSKRRNFWK